MQATKMIQNIKLLSSIFRISQLPLVSNSSSAKIYRRFFIICTTPRLDIFGKWWNCVEVLRKITAQRSHCPWILMPIVVIGEVHRSDTRAVCASKRTEIWSERTLHEKRKTQTILFYLTDRCCSCVWCVWALSIRWLCDVHVACENMFRKRYMASMPWQYLMSLT